MCSCGGGQEIIDYRKNLNINTAQRTSGLAKASQSTCWTNINELKLAVLAGVLTMTRNSWISLLTKNWLDGTLCGYTKPGWYFWDETEANCYGPYPTPSHALAALVCYCWEAEKDD